MPQPISSLPIGAKVKYGKYQVEAEEPQPIIWLVADFNHKYYPENSVTMVAEKILDLRAFDAKEPSNSSNDRKNYGNNRYRDSNIRAWLNSKEDQWYTNQHSADAPPTNAATNGYGTGYDDKPGFLKHFTASEIADILTTKINVARNSATDGSGSESVEDKVFLLGRDEVGLGNESGSYEGTIMPLFTTDSSSRIVTATDQCVTNSLSTSKPSKGGAWHWWLRTPYSSNASYVRNVNSDGALNNNTAFYGNYGVRPALNLPSGISVSDTPDDDGCYTTMPRKAPVISGEDSDLGYKLEGFSVQYTVTDAPENDVVTVVEAVNGQTIKNYVPVLGETNTASVSSELIYSLPNNEPTTLTITATDNDGTTVRTYAFTPWLYSTDKPRVAVQMREPIKTDYPITEITMTLDITRQIEAEITILVCNNGFDDNPTWEDITAAVMSKQAAHLQNTVKTAESWGLNVEIAMKKVNLPGILAINNYVISYR